MAAVAKRLGKGTLNVANSGTLYTVPANTTTLVKALTICNVTSSTINVTLIFGGLTVISSHPIKGNDTITVPFMDQILTSNETITGFSSVNGINYYISGKEVT